MKGVLAYRGEYYFFSRILFAGKVASIFQLSYHSDLVSLILNINLADLFLLFVSV
jgi:hypothetical protein